MSSYRAKSNRVGSKAKVVVRGPRMTNQQIRLYNRIPRGLQRTGGRLPFSVAELKNFDVHVTNMIVPGVSTHQSVAICVPGPGNGATQRIGRRITMKSIQIAVRMNYAGGMIGQSPIRLCVIYDRQTNTLFPAGNDVLVVDGLASYRNLDNSRRFWFLCDEIICPNFGQGTVAQQTSFVWRKFIKCNLPVEFNPGASGTISDVATGGLLLWMWQDGNITVAGPSQDLYCRVKFKDT